MAWFSSRQSRLDLINSLTRSQETDGARLNVTAYELRDNVLWSVVDITALKDGAVLGISAGETLSYIRCDFLQKCGNQWNHESMDESTPPYLYTCPLNFLDMVEEQSPEWRDRVRSHHAHRGDQLGLSELI